MNHDVKSQQKVSVCISHTWLSQWVHERIMKDSPFSLCHKRKESVYNGFESS